MPDTDLEKRVAELEDRVFRLEHALSRALKRKTPFVHHNNGLTEHNIDKAGCWRGFYIHAAIFLAVNALLIGINIFATPTVIWVPYSLLLWGPGVLMHGYLAWKKAGTP